MGSAVKFLCVNELGLRGTAETLRHDEAGNDDIASGLFLKLMEYTLDVYLAFFGIPLAMLASFSSFSKDIQN